MDYRKIEAQAEEVRTAAAALAAKGATEPLEAAERDSLMQLQGKLEALEGAARDALVAENDELRRIADHGTSPSGAEGAEDRAASDAYRSYIVGGLEAVPSEQRAALVAGTDANGGYVVPEPVHGPLIEKARKVSPIIENAANFAMTGDTTMFLPYKSAHGATANATETGARTEQTEPTFTNISLVAYDYYTDQRASQQFLDSANGAEDMLLGWIYGDLHEQFNADACIGYGTTKATGLFQASGTYTTKLSGSAGAIAAAAFLTQFFALPVKYRAAAKWYMSPATLAVAMGFAYPNLNNTPLVQAAADGTFTILGKPVVEVDDAPAIGAANFPVAFGDLGRAYAVGTHKTPTILRDPYTATPNVRFYAIGRMGGIPWDAQALILQKSNNA